MLAGKKKDLKPRTALGYAVDRLERRSVALGKAKKAQRRAEHQNMWREVESWREA